MQIKENISTHVIKNIMIKWKDYKKNVYKRDNKRSKLKKMIKNYKKK